MLLLFNAKSTIIIRDESFSGKFKTYIKRFLCCDKQIELFLLSDKNILNFYKDLEHKNIYLSIPMDDIISVNKHQINIIDIATFSIFYKSPSNKNNICEIKLRVSFKREIDLWLERLKPRINKYKFEIKNSEIEVNELLDNVKKEPIRFYRKINLLEVLILKKKCYQFIQMMKLKYDLKDSIIDLEEIQFLEEKESYEEKKMNSYENSH